MRMLLALALAAFASPALSQPVELPVRVADGASWVITTRRVREDVRTGAAPRRVETNAKYKVTFREGTPQGRLAVELLEGAIGGDVGGGLPLDELKTTFEVEVDEAFAPLRLSNWPQLRAAIYQVMDGRLADPKAREIARSMFEPLTPEHAASVMLPFMAFLGVGQGLALDPTRPHRAKGELPNPLGGPAIGADAVLAIDPATARSGRPVVTWTQAMNPEALRASIGATLDHLLTKAASPEQAAEIAATLKDLSMTREDRCRYEIDAPVGLAATTECVTTQVTTVQGRTQQRTDTWTITQTLPETR